MTYATLKEKIEAGFPLIIHVADGRSYDVPHRDFIWLHPSKLAAIVALPANESPDEMVSVTIPLIMISGVRETVRMPSVGS